MSDFSIDTGMEIPFVPFTFDTVNFCSLAKDKGREITWAAADELWDAYKAGRASGGIALPGNTPQAAQYMKDHTWQRLDTCQAWLDTADDAAKAWWGFGGFFADFGRPGPVAVVTEKAGEIVKAAGKAVSKIGNNLATGIAEGIGLPKWIIGTVALAIGLLILWVTVRAYRQNA